MGISKFFISVGEDRFANVWDSGVGIFIIKSFLEVLNLSALIIIFISIRNVCFLNLKVHVFYIL